jgi:hypothetical protein
MRHHSLVAGLAIAALLLAAPEAGALLIDFEGLQNNEEIQNFYDGGAGSLGSVGPDFNIVFGPGGTGIIDADAGGTGNFANEPSPDTILYNPAAGTYYMDVLPGFTGSVSFFYSNDNSNRGIVQIWDGFGGTGNPLATTGLLPNTGIGPGDPNGGTFGVWQQVVLPFGGVGLSVVFTGDNVVAYDNVEVNPIPEPTAPLLFGAGMLLVGRAMRRWRTA